MTQVAERAGDDTRAALNILEDFAAEMARQAQMHRAIVNILDDAAGERVLLEHERTRLRLSEQVVTNMLEDFADDKNQLVQAQRAMLNLLEDFAATQARADTALVLRETVERLREAQKVAEAANAELDAFSYSAAHDLRAPLRVIDGYSQALSEDFGEHLEVEGRAYLANIRASVRSMTDLIEGLLTLARVTRGSLRLQPVDLSVLARQVVDRLRYLSPERHVNVVMPDGIVAIADRRLILVVLDNLLENAWKFTANRAVANIEFGRRVVDDRMTYFVRDDGAGFEMEFVDKLFGVFQRLHAASEFEGTGIGLATVKRIVRRHGGNIWAEGAVGRGATFSFTIGEEVVA